MQSKTPKKERASDGSLKTAPKAEDVLEQARDLSKDERIKLTHMLIDLSVKLE